MKFFHLALAALRLLGLVTAAAGAALLVFVSAYPLGLIRPYPAPPKAAVEGPLGLARPITDPASLNRNPGEALPLYLHRLTTTVAGGMVHYWTAGDTWSGANTRYTGISIFDNYLEWLLRFSPEYDANLRSYEFMTPAKAIDRGYGFCSQVSKLVYSVLRDQGIDAVIMSNPMHTVVEAAGNILDPDYGVFVPHSIEWVQAHPEALDEYYATFASSLPLLHEAYALPWHVLGDPVGFDQVRRYETRLDELKWWPPLFALCIGLPAFAFGAYFGRRRPMARQRVPNGRAAKASPFPEGRQSRRRQTTHSSEGRNSPIVR